MATFQEVKTAIIEDFVSVFLDSTNTFQNGTPIGHAVDNVQTIIQGGQATGTIDPGTAPVVVFDNDTAAQTDSVFDNFMTQAAQCLVTVNPEIYNSYPQGAITWVNVPNPGQFTYTVSDQFSAECTVIVPYDTAISGVGNFTQFVSLENTLTQVDVDQADQILDNTIYELLGATDTKQAKIEKFFQDYANLKPPELPGWDYNLENYLTTDQQVEYGNIYNVEYQSTPEAGYIPRINNRLDGTPQTSNLNKTRTLQWLRDDLNRYLLDVDAQNVEFVDDRPEYQEISNGYLKIRNLNQAIIVRNEESDDVGLEKEVTTALGTGPSYLYQGFTVTMWVKFLDKVSSGTLFNYGNPTRAESPKGFTLDTVILNGNDPAGSSTWGDLATTYDLDYFSENESARFLRLTVFDKDQKLRSSHRSLKNNAVSTTFPRNYGNSTPGIIPELGETNTIDAAYEGQFLSYTNVPIDFDEWYFIVATFDPAIDENNSYTKTGDLCPDSGGSAGTCDIYNDWWGGNINETITGYTHRSGFGTQAKVEIISKSDLLRARGFKSST